MKIIFILLSLGLSLVAETLEIPTINLSLSAPDTPAQLVSSINVILMLTILFLAPSLLLMTTTFTRFVIVFGFMRQAMGTQQIPPTQLLVSLALLLTIFVMEPVGQKAYDDGIKPYVAEQIDYEEAFEKTTKPFKMFMIRNTREKDLALFFRIRKMDNPNSIDDVPLSVVIPAFMISELKTAFEI
ncbi:flagellar biosynthetic protein FliP, partial [Sulfurimonas sp. MAG313]